MHTPDVQQPKPQTLLSGQQPSSGVQVKPTGHWFRLASHAFASRHWPLMQNRVLAQHSPGQARAIGQHPLGVQSSLAPQQTVAPLQSFAVLQHWLLRQVWSLAQQTVLLLQTRVFAQQMLPSTQVRSSPLQQTWPHGAAQQLLSMHASVVPQQTVAPLQSFAVGQQLAPRHV